MTEVDIEQVQSIHFVGVGGIGMSALARMMHENGKTVSGSDHEHSQILTDLKQEGVTVFDKHDAENVSDGVELLVYSTAILKDNPEREAAQKLGISELSYPEALGLLSKDRYTIAVAGSHGKTTTTAMIHEVVGETLDSTLIVGSLLAERNSNFVGGRSDYFVVEACEYRRSFLQLHPNILVITNIEADHLDYYKNLDDIKHAFNELVRKVPESGFVVCDLGSSDVRDVLVGIKGGVIDAASYVGEDVTLPFPAVHNIENAAKALAVADIFDIPREDALARLKQFKGTWRRQEAKGTMKTGALLFDDYAHHPTEITATLTAFKELYPEKRIVVAFQPHLHSRTEHFFDDFVESLSIADTIITAPVYEARVENKSVYTSSKLARALSEIHNDVTDYNTFEEVEKALKENTSENDVVILMGAGDLYTIGEKLVQ